MGLTYTNRTGIVTIRDFDRGFIETLGGVVVNGEYSVPLPGLQEGTDAGVVFNQPEQVFISHRLPCYLITRGDLEADNHRWNSVKHLDYFMGVSGTIEWIGSVSGYREVEIKAQSWPYNIPYTVACYARYEYDAQVMLSRMMRRFKSYCAIFVTDSLGNVRSYTGFGDTVNNISEIVDVADRVRAYSMTIRVEGEIDLFDPVVLTDTVSGVSNNVGLL